MASPTHRRSRRTRRTALIAAAALAAAGLGALPLVMNASAAPDLAHQALPANDGWAASGTGTTGGSAADSAHVVTVSTQEQLVAALGGATNTTPKIIQIKGQIKADTGSCDSYAEGTGYNLADYLKAYDPSTWGRTEEPSGTQETARDAAKKKQAKSTVFKVPSNTTIVGVPGTRASLLGANLKLQDVDNVIIRNLTMTSPEDCFPQWDPTDGSQGNWNSAYDTVTLRGATHVWVDHNTFTDGPSFDWEEKTYFGRPYQVHDGQLDITNGSDLVTVERNQFTNHDKTTLIGSSDTDSTGKLRVSIHHNVYAGIVQRAPLARIGQVHVYNNLYRTRECNGYKASYSVNARAAAQVVLENNYWELSKDRKVSQLLTSDGTGAIADSGNLVNGRATDLVGAYNAANPDKQLTTSVNWTPKLKEGLEPAENLPISLAGTTGARVLTSSDMTSANTSVATAPTKAHTTAATTAPTTAATTSATTSATKPPTTAATTAATTSATAPAKAPEVSPVGYGAGTTGGGSAPATTVSTLAAFTSAVSGDTAKVVKVSGLISLSGQVDIGSNTTVIGVGSGSGFTGGGLRVCGESNVIIRNLNLSKPIAPNDAIGIEKSTRVWVDHNDLSSDRSHGKDYYDGLLDIKRGSDYISVSWNKFHDHYKTSLIGHADNNAAEDTGHLRVTFSHNWFYNLNSRVPSIRFGKVHMLNNYFQDIAGSGIHSRMGAEVYAEQNVFTNVNDAIITTGDSDVDGYANELANIYTNSPKTITQTSSYKPTYSYIPESSSTTVASVTAGAGTGKVG